MSQKFAGVKGMNDLLPPDIDVWRFVENTARQVFGCYGFAEMRTPMVEDTALFVRGVGEGTDIVGKEMYTFCDKGDRSITLRPEGTAPAARAYIEHSIHVKEPVTRWFYAGPMFRYERMKTGRYRQFSQIGAEAYGSAHPAQDVEVMELAVHFLQAIGLGTVTLQLNSLGDASTRPAYGEKVRAHFSGHPLSPEATATLAKNPMRLLDSKDPELAGLIASAPVLLDSIDDESKKHFDEVRRLLDLVGVKYALNPRLVRGLDYYTRTAFELVADDPVLGTASAVGGGGRYDALVEQLGGPKTPAVGFAMGLDRLCLLLAAKGTVAASRPDLFLVAFDDSCRDEVVKRVTALRHQGLKVDFDSRAGSFKSQLKRSENSRALHMMVIGQAELDTGRGRLKSMDLPKEHPDKEREVRLDELAAALQMNGNS